MAGHDADVEILLSTFNGAAHLDELLESIARQNFTRWSLIIRDDGSSDGTVEIIWDWADRYPEKIRILDAGSDANTGAVRSFSRLLESSIAPYVMFADQDDVWLPAKVTVTLQAMRRREAQSVADSPILVHTDLTVVDDQLNVVNKSLWRYQGVVPGTRPTFSRIMVENVAWGCTEMLNRPLIEIIRNIPTAAVYHDWWVALVASAFGEIVALTDPTILYRRHAYNESDISNIRAMSLWAMIHPRAARRRLDAVLEQSRTRVAAFVDRYRNQMRPNQIAAAEALLHLKQEGFLSRRRTILRHGLLFGSQTRNAALFALV